MLHFLAQLFLCMQVRKDDPVDLLKSRIDIYQICQPVSSVTTRVVMFVIFCCIYLYRQAEALSHQSFLLLEACILVCGVFSNVIVIQAKFVGLLKLMNCLVYCPDIYMFYVFLQISWLPRWLNQDFFSSVLFMYINSWSSGFFYIFVNMDLSGLGLNSKPRYTCLFSQLHAASMCQQQIVEQVWLEVEFWHQDTIAPFEFTESHTSYHSTFISQGVCKTCLVEFCL